MAEFFKGPFINVVVIVIIAVVVNFQYQHFNTLRKDGIASTALIGLAEGFDQPITERCEHTWSITVKDLDRDPNDEPLKLWGEFFTGEEVPVLYRLDDPTVIIEGSPTDSAWSLMICTRRGIWIILLVILGVTAFWGMISEGFFGKRDEKEES